MKSPLDILVVGCGFAGATIARVLAEQGYRVRMIDQRPHLGGNAFDELHVNGERLHRYGPHLLHGKAGSAAIKFLSRFTEWVPYEHRVRALLPDGRTTPLPVNANTLEDVFGIELKNEEQARQFLAAKRIAIDHPANTDEFFLASVGEELTNLFFRPYTRKMWGRDAKELQGSIGARLPVRVNRDDRYFNDDFQALPEQGYKAMFERILDHSLISVGLSECFESEMRKHYKHCFASIPIDVFFGCCNGPLPYRSILFEHRLHSKPQAAAVTNFTDEGGYTRSTEWAQLPNSPQPRNGQWLATYERPCDLDSNPGESYYPVLNAESNALLDSYIQLAGKEQGLTFIGRTGLFRYLDMVPAVTLHLEIAQSFLRDQGRI